MFYATLTMEDASRITKKVFWQKSLQIPKTPWTICGYSRSAHRTGFYIKDLDMMLDAGPQNFNHPTSIFITHTHGDHIAELPFTLIAEHGKEELVHIYGPAEAEPYIRNYINRLFSTNAMMPMAEQCETDNYYLYHGKVPHDRFEIKAKQTQLIVEVFECDHRIPTISYGFSEPKQKLKPEYEGIPGKEIAKLRLAGTEVTQNVIMKRFAYVCDTTIKVLDLHPEILSYPVVFIECTFLPIDANEPESNCEKMHIYWTQLRPYIVAHPDITFILFHFSQRFSDAEISEFFKKENLPNIIWW